MKEIAFENGRISNFQRLVTLTLDRVILHTFIHHSSTSTYVPNFIEIKETFVDRRTDRQTYIRRTDRHWRPALLGRLCQRVDLIIMMIIIITIIMITTIIHAFLSNVKVLISDLKAQYTGIALLTNQLAHNTYISFLRHLMSPTNGTNGNFTPLHKSNDQWELNLHVYY